MANKKTKSTTMESALQKAVEEQENSDSSRIKRLLARKKNLQRRKRAKLPPSLRK